VSLPFKGVVNGAAVAGSVATGAAFFRAAAAGASGDAVTALAGVAVLGAFLGEDR
jgi:hypothetical protein